MNFFRKIVNFLTGKDPYLDSLSAKLNSHHNLHDVVLDTKTSHYFSVHYKNWNEVSRSLVDKEIMGKEAAELMFEDCFCEHCLAKVSP